MNCQAALFGRSGKQMQSRRAACADRCLISSAPVGSAPSSQEPPGWGAWLPTFQPPAFWGRKPRSDFIGGFYSAASVHSPRSFPSPFLPLSFRFPPASLSALAARFHSGQTPSSSGDTSLQTGVLLFCSQSPGGSLPEKWSRRHAIAKLCGNWICK